MNLIRIEMPQTQVTTVQIQQTMRHYRQTMGCIITVHLLPGIEHRQAAIVLVLQEENEWHRACKFTWY